MLWFAMLFGAGVLSFQQLPALPAPGWALPMALASGLLLRWRGSRPTAGLPIGFAWAHLFAVLNPLPAIPAADSGPTAFLASGTLESLPEYGKRRTRFVFRVHRLDDGQRSSEGHWRIRVSWQGAPEVKPGQVWQLPLRVRPVHGYASPGAWDYEGHLHRRGIRYGAYVNRRNGPAILLGDSGCCAVDRVRQRLSIWLDGLQASDFARGVLRALVVADRSGLSPEARAQFRETGTSHLMAVSGLHVGLAAGIGFLFVAPLWRRVPRLCGRMPARHAASVFGLGVAFAYSLLAGMQLPTQRALIMLCVYAAAFLSRREADPWHTLAAAWILVLVWHPASIVEVGLWLSFGAVSIITAVLRHYRSRRKWQQAVAVQLAITLGLWPLLSLFGMTVSVLAPIVNLLLVPLFAFLVVPLSLIGSLLAPLSTDVAATVLETLSIGLDMLPVLLRAAGRFGWSLPGGDANGPMAVLLALAAVLWLQPPGLPIRRVAGVLLIGLVLPRVDRVPAGDFRVAVLDVGQGFSAVIETQHHCLVFDTGPEFSSGFSAASAVLLPYLGQRGATAVDRLVVSHGDRDHAGGLRLLTGRVDVVETLSGEPERLSVDAAPCVAGERWRWDGVLFEFLQPPRSAGLRGNNASCVLRVSNQAGSLLLTGDIEQSVEQWLVNRRNGALESRVVVASHHGSRSSSSGHFVEATRPDYVVFAAGWANRYGFPAAEVAARWARAGVHGLDTATAGTIGFHFRRDGGLLGPTLHRVTERRYWHHDGGSVAGQHAVSSTD